MIWADTAQELIERFPKSLPKSLTFIPSKLTDNKILMAADPGYLANLMNLPRVDYERLMNGNWKVRPTAGSYFPRYKVGTLSAIPSDVVQWVRRWDLAATTPSEVNPSPDATAGVLMGLRANGRVVIANAVNVREDAHFVRQMIKNVAEQDQSSFKHVTTCVPQDPGQAGKDQAATLIAYLTGHFAKGIRETGPKTTRAEPLSAQWQAGNVDLVGGKWNVDYLNEMEIFPEGKHDDYVDASSGAYLELTMKVDGQRRRMALAS
jgi:predicted phage terminase large subunit-like protein